MEDRTIRPIANATVFEIITGLRREFGNHCRLLCVLTMTLLVPVVLVLTAIAADNAAGNLENRRLLSAFVANAEMRPENLKQSVLRMPGIEQVSVLPASANVPAILEITPASSLTLADIDELVSDMQRTGAFSFINADGRLLQRNSNSADKAKALGLVLFLLALVLSALTCLVVIKREIFSSNGATINLKRQLGATLTAIARPYVLRAAGLTAIAISLAAALVTVFYRILQQHVDISSYSEVLLNSVPVWHLIILAIVSVAAACFAAATALQSIFVVLNQILKGTIQTILPGYPRQPEPN